MALSHKLSKTVLLVAALQMAFFYFPLALPRALGISVPYAFDVMLPAISALSAMALALLLMTNTVWMVNRSIGWCVLVYGVCAACSSACNDGTLVEFLNATGRITIPVALAVSVRQFAGTPTIRTVIASVLGMIWLVNVTSCLFDGRLRGICGNQNWVAATTVATATFVRSAYVFWMATLTTSQSTADAQSQPVPSFSGWLRLIDVFLSVLVAVLTIFVVVRTSCRASWLAIGAYVALRLLEKRGARSVLMVIALVVGSVVAVSAFNIRRPWITDVRKPMWQSALLMISDKPLTGHGPDQFRKNFVDYKSTNLNRRLVDAIINHPHNEILFVAANIGVPAAVIWLVVCCLAVGPRKHDWEAPRIAAVTLLCHGLFDRPLEISPSSVIFPLVLALLLADKLAAPESDKRVRMIPIRRAFGPLVFGGGVLVASVLVFDQIQSDMAFRRGNIIRDLANNISDPSTQLMARNQAFEQYERSCKSLTFRPEKHLYAGMLAVEELKSSQLGRFHFEKILQFDPQFGFTNYLLGRCDLRDAFDSKLDSHAQRTSAIRAVQYLTDDLTLHPLATRVHEQLIIALSRAGAHARVCNAQSVLSEVYRERLELHCHEHGVSGKSLVDGWLSRDPSARSMRWSQSLTANVTFSAVDRVDVQHVVPELKQVHQFVRSTGLHKKDVALWTEALNLQSEFGDSLTAVELFEKLARVQVTTKPGKPFSWPLEVWTNRQGTPFESACLLSAVVQQQGHTSIITGSGNSTAAVINWNGDVYRVQPLDWTWQHSPKKEWQTFAPEMREQFLGISSRNSVFRIFVYPPAFRHRNRAISALLESASGNLLPDNPYVTVSKAILAFPEFQELPFAKQPFERLEDELTE